jgi:hypothetical protein
MSCGWYNGRKILDLAAKIAAKAERAKKAAQKN